MLKCDFHLHTSDDPVDSVRYSSKELVDLAASRGYDVLSITNHGRMSWSDELVDYAAARNILLIPGIESLIDGKHVVVLNAGKDVEGVGTFGALKEYKSAHPELFVYAPHPFYPKRHCLWKELERNIDIFDGVEYCHFYLAFFNWFNNQAVRIARKHGRTVIGNSDSHNLRQFESTYTLVDAPKDAGSVLSALREGKVEIITRPIPLVDCLCIFLHISRNTR